MTISETDGTIQAYLDVVDMFWPGSAASLGPADRARSEFLVLPSRRSPRLLVPRDNHAAGSRSMRRFSSSLAPGETVRRLVVAATLRARLDRFFPDRIAFDAVHPSLVDHLQDVLGEPVNVSIGLGNARQNRKPVLQVFSRKGRSLAFVKVGDNPASRAHVEAEIQAFSALEGARLPADLEVPRMLWHGEWQGLRILVMTPLETSALQRPGQWAVPAPTMDAFSRSFGQGRMPLSETDWWSWADATPAHVSPEKTRSRLRHALDRLADRASGEDLEIGAWHGDWTPWNQSRSRGKLQLWDWERFETGVPTGLDRVHYTVNAKTRADGATLAAIRAGLELAGATDVVSAVYLAAITCRYLRLAEGEYGDLLLDRAHLMLDALGEALGPARRLEEEA